jgi:TonB family protein
VTKGPIDADRWTLEPEYPLRPATLYRMAFVALPKGFDFEHEGWTTLDTVDRTPPVWTKLPAVSDTESIREEMVTDHQTSAAIVFDAGDEGWLAALLQVERPGEAKPSDPAPTWLVPLWQRQNGSFRVYAPCASCATGDVRLVRLTLLDLAGNRSATRSVRFRVPPLPSPPRSHVVTTLDPPTTVRRLVEPAYTVIAQRARIQGTAEGTLAVDATGVVTVVEIQKTLRFGLDEATVEALLQWKFPPAETPTRQYAFTSRFQLVQEVYAPKWGVDPP